MASETESDLDVLRDLSRRFDAAEDQRVNAMNVRPHEWRALLRTATAASTSPPVMKCPECVRAGQRSKLYMPTSYFSTAMAGTETYYDEDGVRHRHEMNSHSGQGHCSNGHQLDVTLSDECPAKCGWGHPLSITFVPSEPDEPASATGVVADNVTPSKVWGTAQ